MNGAPTGQHIDAIGHNRHYQSNLNTLGAHSHNEQASPAAG